MKSGFCPKCGTNDVLRVRRHQVETILYGEITFDDYMCLDCGYVETFSDNHIIIKLQRSQQSEKMKNKNEGGKQ